MRAGEGYAFLSNGKNLDCFKPLIIFIPFFAFCIPFLSVWCAGVCMGAGAMDGAKRREGRFYGVISSHHYVSSGAPAQVTGLAWHLYLLSHPNGPLF